jgi:hypothetical protein
MARPANDNKPYGIFALTSADAGRQGHVRSRSPPDRGQTAAVAGGANAAAADPGRPRGSGLAGLALGLLTGNVTEPVKR